MRMDIEISPGAALEHSGARPRDNLGLGAGELAGGEGGMAEKRVCSARHPAPLRRERRFIEERTKGVLWRHSSFNLVEPPPVAPEAA
jgi:hypothetical protein